MQPAFCFWLMSRFRERLGFESLTCASLIGSFQYKQVTFGHMFNLVCFYAGIWWVSRRSGKNQAKQYLSFVSFFIFFYLVVIQPKGIAQLKVSLSVTKCQPYFQLWDTHIILAEWFLSSTIEPTLTLCLCVCGIEMTSVAARLNNSGT